MNKSARFVIATMVACVGVALAVAPAFAISALSALGSGTCDASSSGTCTGVSGSANAGALGSGTFSFSLNLSTDSAPNGVGGLCRIASGTGTLVGSATITLAEVGAVCDIGASGGPQAFDGSFFVTGGSGLASTATGSGSLIWSVDTGGNVIVSALGSGTK